MKKVNERNTRKKSDLERRSVVKLSTVFKAMRNGKEMLDIDGVTVKITSLRMQTFLEKGQVCVGCGLKATFFAVEKAKGNVWHLNLYGVDGEGDEVLFTQDHIFNRAAGGKDSLSNSETMCLVCNIKKSVVEGKEGVFFKKLHLLQDAWREMIAREPNIAEIMGYEKRLNLSIQFEDELKNSVNDDRIGEVISLGCKR